MTEHYMDKTWELFQNWKEFKEIEEDLNKDLANLRLDINENWKRIKSLLTYDKKFVEEQAPSLVEEIVTRRDRIRRYEEICSELENKKSPTHSRMDEARIKELESLVTPKDSNENKVIDYAKYPAALRTIRIDGEDYMVHKDAGLETAFLQRRIKEIEQKIMENETVKGNEKDHIQRLLAAKCAEYAALKPHLLNFAIEKWIDENPKEFLAYVLQGNDKIDIDIEENLEDKTVSENIATSDKELPDKLPEQMVLVLQKFGHVHIPATKDHLNNFLMKWAEMGLNTNKIKLEFNRDFAHSLNISKPSELVDGERGEFTNHFGKIEWKIDNLLEGRIIVKTEKEESEAQL